MVVEFKSDNGIQLRSTAFLSAINSTGVAYTGKTALDGLAGSGLFPPPPNPQNPRLASRWTVAARAVIEDSPASSCAH